MFATARLAIVTPADTLTATGADREVVVPSPTCPLRFLPQQKATPDAFVPHAVELPVATDASVPRAGAGVTTGSGNGVESC
ncbi:MAG: hypothetical protein EBQ56_00375 [Proteobacteria bacterium]|nr:hypothetical protein [Pseudomonadota bacterium]